MGACTARYITGARRYDPCPHPATFIVNLPYGAPSRVCGYHVRAYSPEIVYPLSWSLAAIRRWQQRNRDDLTRPIR